MRLRDPAICRAAVAGLVLLVAACADEPTGPRKAAPQAVDAGAAFGVSASARGELGAALHFMRDQSERALKQRNAAARVARAFATLAARVEGDDRRGAERALAAARSEIARYRELVGNNDEAAADLEAMSITLDRASALVADAARTPTTTKSERQP